jgi:hypothetical protein
MSPRPGGEADKFGNRYEGAWTVQHVLHVLRGAAESITVEDIDDLGQGAEFTFKRTGQPDQVHQLKRQNGTANTWNPRSLLRKGIWENARLHVEAGRHFHFVSMLPSYPLYELTDRARRSDSADSFVKELPQGLQGPFSELTSSAIFGSPEVAWNILRGLWIEWPDERNINNMNSAVAGLLLEGATGRLAAVGLGDLVQYNLHTRLDAATVESKLSEYGLRRVQLARSQSIVELVTSATKSWMAGVDRELLRPTIARAEADSVVDLLRGEDRLVLLSGDAGDGKSAVLKQVVEHLAADNVAVLGCRLDRLDSFSSTAQLGSRLDLPVSPVTALSVVAGERPSVLVIDQLDAVSLASGRMPQSFDAIADVIREASAFPTMRILLACRKFDVENDHRIRELTNDKRSGRIEVAKLSDEQVANAVQEMGLDPTALSDQQITLLRSPLNLVLLQGIADQDDALSFQTDNGLFSAFWERKQNDSERRRKGVRFADVIEAIAHAMSTRQRLSVDISVLDRGNLAVDAAVLVSEHVLTRDGRQIAFFHEAFFAYVFARGWMNGEQSLVEFLVTGEQELFRRAQVRQILHHLRTAEPERFVNEVEEVLLDARIRFHIKDVVLRILAALPDPTSDEWEMLSRVLETHPQFEERIWLSLRTLGWFERLDADGVLSDWLSSNDEQDHNNALNVMLGGIKELPDRMAELLRPYAGRASKYGDWLFWIIRFADVHTSRPLFDLLLDAIKNGTVSNYGHNLWMFTYDLAKQQPAWGVELLATHLVLRPNAFAITDSGKVEALLDRDHAVIRLAVQSAEGAPRLFCETLLPYMLAVMRVTEREFENHLDYDAHFCHRTPQNMFHELEDALLFSYAGALRSFAGQDPMAARPLLDALAADRHDTAQWLLYEGIRGEAAEHYADWAAGLLLEGSTRFLSGYMSNGVWTTRQLIQAIAPHLSPQRLNTLERAILDLRFPWERRNPGWYVFCLLTAIDESRLLELGRRRLGELRRLTGMEQPHEPEPMEMHAVPSPIAPEAAQYMSDDNWLQAMARYSSSDREGRRFLEGGAYELSHVLGAETTKDPERFARLALRLDGSVNPVYTDAILMSLGNDQAEALPDPTPIFQAMRHIASLRLAPSDRWLGHPLRHYLKSEIPDDIVSLLVERILNADDLHEDRRWSRNDVGGGRERLGDEIYTAGINTTRGSLASDLANVLILDSDGHRTALVAPSLPQMTQHPSVAVLSCVTQVVTACLRHARPASLEAFRLLAETEDDRLFATHTVERLTVYVGNGDPALAMPLVQKMLASEDADVRDAGGRMAAFACMEWSQEGLLPSLVASSDASTRRGAAYAFAHRLPHSTNSAVAADALRVFVADTDESVRAAAAEVAGALHNKPLRPFREVLATLIESSAFPDAAPQLLFTLEYASDRVDDLVTACTRRFISTHGRDIGNMATGAAGDARQVAQLVFRGYAQATSTVRRRDLLDLIDQLLQFNAFGTAELVDAAER